MFHVPVLRVAQFSRWRVQTLQQHPLFQSQISIIKEQKANHFGTAAANTMDNIPRMISSHTDVSLRLTKQILRTKADQDSNIVFSPLSIQLLLSEIAVTSNGATLDQLLRFLKSKSLDHLGSFSFEIIPVLLANATSVGGPLLSSANGVWIDTSLPFDPTFKEIMFIVFRGDSNQADFRNQADQALSEVNSWAEKETKGLIKEILPPESIDKHTRIILANALCFKGAWINEPFDLLKTEDKDFHLINGSSVKVPFMTSGDDHDQIIGVYEGFKALRLPYKQGDGDDRQFSMYIFLPNTKYGLPALSKKICSETAGSLEHYLPSRKVKVGEFRIPRFKLSFGLEASEVLKGLGLELPFLCGAGDWTQIVELPADQGDIHQKLYISSIFHKSFIEVDEQGTKADDVTAAAAAAIGSSTAVPPTDFVADHPFLFMIREDATGVVMLVGHVVNPLEC